jgi:peptidoglycan/xylan/chitin deacetylase (PgdA/CDA1 family)
MDSDSELNLLNRSTVPDLVSTTSWLRYDRIAVPRIIELYRKYDIKQTFFVPGWCAERYPDLVRMMVDGGHEVAHHGYLHEYPSSFTKNEEEYWFNRGLEALENVAGVRPVGFRAPMYRFSRHTADLLVNAGFSYDSSLMGDDIPYVLRSSAGKIVELPTDWAMDDWPQYTHNPDLGFAMPTKSPQQANEVFISQFDAAWEYGGLWVTVWHPFVSGRLSRLMHIDKMIQYMVDKGDVWFAPMHEIAKHVASVTADGSFTPYEESIPFYDGPIDELSLMR